MSNITKNSKLRLIKPMGIFDNIGEVCDVLDIVDDVIYFKFGNGVHMGCMSADELQKYFEVVSATMVREELIDKIIEDATWCTETFYDKCTVVAMQLDNGFVLVESSACVDPKNYSEEVGFDICMRKLRDRIWELEGYRLQCELTTSNQKPV